MLIESVNDYFLKNQIDIKGNLEMIDGLNDTYFFEDKALERLISDYKKYNEIIVAYDFDDTVSPYLPENHCDAVVRLLQICSMFSDFRMICFTARSTPAMINEAKTTLDRLKIRYDVINENLPTIEDRLDITCESKVLYSIFLDDRCGLKSAFNTLYKFVKWYINQPAISD